MSIVFALATPAAKSAICVFRVSGEDCLNSLSKFIEKPLDGLVGSEMCIRDRGLPMQKL